MAQNSRDKVAAHRFMLRRVRAALLEGDAESNDRPLSRASLASYAGFFVTILILGIVAVVGLLRPGGATKWSEAGAFVIERETGARYVYLDETLHPVLNYATARLLLGDRLHVVTVSRNSLVGVNHGDAIGIPNAPDSLPDQAHVVSTDWSVCATGDPRTGKALPTEVLPGVLAAGAPFASTDGLLLRTPTGRTHLLWQNRAFEVPAQWLAAVGLRAEQGLLVTDAFVSALPTGQTIQPIAVAGRGSPGAVLEPSQTTVVGEVLTDKFNQSYVVTLDGLAKISPLQATLLLADPAAAATYGSRSATATPVLAQQLTGVDFVSLPAVGLGEAAPPELPSIMSTPVSDSQLCAQILGGEVTFVLGPQQDRARSVIGGSVKLATGYGALVAATPHPGAAPSEVFLVTDTGVSYPVADETAMTNLGLGKAPVAVLPQAVVALIPTGPTLSVDGARALNAAVLPDVSTAGPTTSSTTEGG